MGNLFESLKNYFESTPKEVLDKDWKEIEYLNEIGPDVIEYAKFVKECFGIEVPYSNFDKNLETHKFDVAVSPDSAVAANAKYYYAA